MLRCSVSRVVIYLQQILILQLTLHLLLALTTNALTQCFNGHQFVFTNNSTIAFGTMNYNWDMGDGPPH